MELKCLGQLGRNRAGIAVLMGILLFLPSGCAPSPASDDSSSNSGTGMDCSDLDVTQAIPVSKDNLAEIFHGDQKNVLLCEQDEASGQWQRHQWVLDPEGNACPEQIDMALSFYADGGDDLCEEDSSRSTYLLEKTTGEIYRLHTPGTCGITDIGC